MDTNVCNGYDIYRVLEVDGNDLDGDGATGCDDVCPNDGTRQMPGLCGCFAPLGADAIDSDGDGVADCVDGCPNNGNKTTGFCADCGHNTPLVATAAVQYLNYMADNDAWYGNYLNCSWIITSGTGGRVVVNVTNLQTQNSYDVLHIGDKAALSGFGVPLQNTFVFDSGEAAFISFNTDASIGYAGWRLSYFVDDGDVEDECPSDPAKLWPGACGCGVVDDANNDLIPDCVCDPTACASPSAFCTSYGCQCNNGYEGNNVTGCVDVDECATGTHSCSAGSTCVNTVGWYNCTCDAGLVTSGSSCYTPCGSVLQATSDPQEVVYWFDDGYSNNADCSWTIVGSPSGFTVVNMTRMRLETGWDHLDVGHNGTRWTGALSPDAHLFHVGDLNVSIPLRFRSDGIVSWQGFVLNYFIDGDSDGDGFPDRVDVCPSDALKTTVDQCGCGVPDDGDKDGDGVADCIDECVDDANKTATGLCGCNVADTDSDGDGVPDCNDVCPFIAHATPVNCGSQLVVATSCPMGFYTGNTSVPACTDVGLAAGDVCWSSSCGGGNISAVSCYLLLDSSDSDGDFASGCSDLCPSDGDKTRPGVCGCGVADEDSDGDGVMDCVDACPSVVQHTLTCGAHVIVEWPGCPPDGNGDLVPCDSPHLQPGDFCEGDGECGTIDTEVCEGGYDIYLVLESDGNDLDGDGATGCNDMCPDDSTRQLPGVCGCDAPMGASNIDTDGDGVADCVDGCPHNSNRTSGFCAQCGNNTPLVATMTVKELDYTSANGALYYSNMHCSWVIVPATSGGRVVVNVTSLQTEYTYDTLSIGGKAVMSGFGVPLQHTFVFDQGQAVHISFTTDYGGVYKGWTLNYFEENGDVVDECPNDPAKLWPGECGCGEVDDSNNDGIPDCLCLPGECHSDGYCSSTGCRCNYGTFGDGDNCCVGTYAPYHGDGRYKRCVGSNWEECGSSDDCPGDQICDGSFTCVDQQICSAPAVNAPQLHYFDVDGGRELAVEDCYMYYGSKCDSWQVLEWPLRNDGTPDTASPLYVKYWLLPGDVSDDFGPGGAYRKCVM